MHVHVINVLHTVLYLHARGYDIGLDLRLYLQASHTTSQPKVFHMLLAQKPFFIKKKRITHNIIKVNFDYLLANLANKIVVTSINQKI